MVVGRFGWATWLIVVDTEGKWVNPHIYFVSQTTAPSAVFDQAVQKRRILERNMKQSESSQKKLIMYLSFIIIMQQPLDSGVHGGRRPLSLVAQLLKNAC